MRKKSSEGRGGRGEREGVWEGEREREGRGWGEEEDE